MHSDLLLAITKGVSHFNFSFVFFFSPLPLNWDAEGVWLRADGDDKLVVGDNLLALVQHALARHLSTNKKKKKNTRMRKQKKVRGKKDPGK